jgi:hypothetical protein
VIEGGRVLSVGYPDEELKGEQRAQDVVQS